jgi:hypothetical protein
MAMKMRGVGIATAVDIEAAIYQCCQGEDVYIAEILRDEAVRKAYQSVSSRPVLKASLGHAPAAERKCGF